MDPKTQMLLDTVKKLIRRGANTNINNLLKKTHPADIAHLFRYLDLKEQLVLFNILEDVDTSAEVLSELDHGASALLLEQLDKDSIVQTLQHMSHDDAVDIIQNMSEELADDVLDGMRDECSEEIEQLMQYQEDTAGGIMSTEFFSLREDMTA
ncbi:MAG: magnesium transporter, partial [Desulfobacteraceae bacterium 4572_35.1]